MIKIRIRDFSINFDFTFFAVFFIFMIGDTSGYGILALYACLLHELGHLIVMLTVGCIPTGLLFYFAGMKITAPQRYRLSFFKELMVLIGGSGVNFILFVLCYFGSDKLTLRLPVFAIINLLIGIFNLIPLGMFDGGKITELVLSKFIMPDTAYYVTKILSIVLTLSALIASIILYCFDIVNFTIVATLCYVTFLCALTDA